MLKLKGNIHKLILASDSNSVYVGGAACGGQVGRTLLETLRVGHKFGHWLDLVSLALTLDNAGRSE